eukprot:2055019-Rhodomonas_salina.1
MGGEETREGAQRAGRGGDDHGLNPTGREFGDLSRTSRQSPECEEGVAGGAATSVQTGRRVWIPDDDDLWIGGTVVKVNTGTGGERWVPQWHLILPLCYRAQIFNFSPFLWFCK